ncbi:RNA-binding domain-containing protein [Periconia macrospinosa]|uniref:RNA-binding domain-containing protein n=1 Tax=Periconia macrospinosa TaxID=97972 RepID=A0A2V1E0G6_9PLEO|nr:RNA-binding domain-containing protein [Periconia macrospinosa]
MAATERLQPPGVSDKPTGLPANETLYVRQLSDKLQKSDLKRMLYMLFASYGVILDIVALKNEKMRGQAHITFRDIDSATQAMRALDGFNLCGKEMQISYAKSKSKVFAKLKGTVYASEKGVPAAGATDQSKASIAAFGAAPAKAVPINEQDRAKGVKRAREEDEEDEAEKNNDESDDSEAEMQISSDEESD